MSARFGRRFAGRDNAGLREMIRDAARRFVTLIDTLYEAGARLVVLAAAEPDDIYPDGLGSFEFERTASRLHEMRSAAWLEKTET